ncbi:MAG: hypothetical protein HFJ84_02530 [Clostridiales bacterium]|jgi:hypothetical protein|nr:hypothetical protein [Clostridiales bacterium]
MKIFVFLAVKLQVLGVGIDQQAISKIQRNARIITDYEVFCLVKAFGVITDEILQEEA